MTIATPRPDRHTFPSTPEPVERLALTVEETAALLGISRTSAYLACQRGELPSRLIGRRRVVPKAALDAYLASVGGTGAA